MPTWNLRYRIAIRNDQSLSPCVLMWLQALNMILNFDVLKQIHSRKLSPENTCMIDLRVDELMPRILRVSWYLRKSACP